MADDYCTECKTYTLQVYDRSAGDTICSECGLVLESRAIDETVEWRKFSNDTDDHNPVRVGNRINPLLSSGGLGTIITKNPSPSSSKGDGIKNWKNKSNGKDGHLLIAFKTMDGMADNLGLLPTIINHAKELFKKADNEKIFARFKYQRAIMAACLYLACQEEGFPRTFKEIYTAANGARVKDIHKAMAALKKQLKVGKKTIHAKDIARRFCSNLGLNNQIIRAVQETVQNSGQFHIRRTPTSILAATIFMITQLSEKKISFRGKCSP